MPRLFGFLLLVATFPAAAVALAVPPRAATQPTVAQYESFAMTHGGDVARGRGLFFNETKLACSRCHSLEAKEVKVGPPLFAAGDKFGRRDLVESILRPSATIAVGY